MMKLTLPQLIMYNHASWVNNERSEKRSKAKAEKEKQQQNVPSLNESDDPVVYKGKRLSELTTNEYRSYWVNCGMGDA
jgi:hypothetical protein